MGKGTPALLTAALIVGLLVAGCGGGGNSGANSVQGGSDSGSASSNPGSTSSGSPQKTTETKTIAKAEFIQKANAICQATIQKVLGEAAPALAKAPEGSQDRPAVERELASKVMAPALRGEIEQVQALGTPPGDGQQIEAILNAIQGLAEVGEENPAEMVRNKNLFTPPANLAERYGIDSCPYG